MSSQVLLVDDDSLQLNLLGGHLGSAGYSVVDAADGDIGLLARLRAGERSVRLYDDAAQAAHLQSERNHLSDAVHTMEQVLTVVEPHPRKWPIRIADIAAALEPAAKPTAQESPVR